MAKSDMIQAIRAILQPKEQGFTTVYYRDGNKEVDSGYKIPNVDGVNRKMIMSSADSIEALKQFMEAQ